MIELKPCPFCGGEANITKGERWLDETCTPSKPYYYARCQNCYTTGYKYHPTEKEAIEAWNTRVGEHK